MRKSVTLRVDLDLHRRIADYLNLVDVQMQDFVAAALRRELDDRLLREDAETRETLETVTNFRKARTA